MPSGGVMPELPKSAETDNMLLQGILECLSDWIWEVDADGRYTYCSPSIEKILGYTPDEIIGKTPFDLMTHEDKDRIRSIFLEIASKKQPVIGLENRCLTKGGSQVLLSTTGVPIIDDEGNLQGYRGVDTDITEKKLMEQQLCQSGKMDAIGRLAAGIAHEFNSKLMVILGNVGLAKMEIENREKVLECLGEIADAADHSRQITTKLLGFSRNQLVMPLILDLNISISKTVHTLSSLVGKGIALSFLPGNDLWYIKLDPVQLDQIVMNMTLNARDAMPYGGEFIIETANVTVDDEQCRFLEKSAPGEYVSITFRDSGTGMDTETLNHLFDPFFTTKGPGKGTGLGLSNVHGIVMQNNGFIDVWSKPGDGSVFIVWFPRHQLIPE